jgi:membrane protease YdiL (CAAX protease family)
MNTPDIASIFFLAILSFITISLGKKRGFFFFQEQTPSLESQIQWIHVASVFAIYFGVSVGLSPFAGKILQQILFTKPSPTTLLSYATWINFINSGAILLFTLIFFLSLPKLLRREIWRGLNNSQHVYRKDLMTAALAWIISFPPVLFINQLSDWMLSHVFHFQQMPEQLAVYFLKMTFGYPLYLSLAIITIIVFAPIVEELLFRGFLQSLIRKHLGSKQAIVITSVLFAFFHYSPEQGLSNITIVTSLFIFSLFLGFTYEKRRSLPAPMILHAIFNGVNVCNLYFLGGIPGGCL